MSNEPNPGAEKTSRDRQRELFVNFVGWTIWLYLLLVLVGAVRVLMVVWPGNQWIDAWYGTEGRSRAAFTAMEHTLQSLQDSRDALALLDGATDNPLTVTQRKTLNQGLAIATEIDESAAATPAVGTAVPTSARLKEMNAVLDRGQQALRKRIAAAQAPPPCPHIFWDLFFGRLPPGKCGDQPSAFVWRPLVSENKIYDEKLAEARKGAPAAWFGSEELHYALIVILFGVIGGATQALLSLATYVGNQSLRERWTLYYFGVPWIGGSFALTFYVFLRGGFMSTGTTASQAANLYAFSALALLVGLSTQQAAAKIQRLALEILAEPKAASDKVSEKRPTASNSTGTPTPPPAQKPEDKSASSS